MVKLFLKDEKLYMNIGNRNISVSKVTVEHQPGMYTLFLGGKHGDTRGKSTFEQTSYPLTDIKLKKTKEVIHSRGMINSIYISKGKHHLIEYYKI